MKDDFISYSHNGRELEWREDLGSVEGLKGYGPSGGYGKSAWVIYLPAGGGTEDAADAKIILDVGRHYRNLFVVSLYTSASFSFIEST